MNMFERHYSLLVIDLVTFKLYGLEPNGGHNRILLAVSNIVAVSSLEIFVYQFMKIKNV